MDTKQAYLSKPWLKYYPDGVPEAPQIPELSVVPVERLDQLRTGSRRTIRVIMGVVMIALGIILLLEVI